MPYVAITILAPVGEGEGHQSVAQSIADGAPSGCKFASNFIEGELNSVEIRGIFEDLAVQQERAVRHDGLPIAREAE